METVINGLLLALASAASRSLIRSLSGVLRPFLEAGAPPGLSLPRPDLFAEACLFLASATLSLRRCLVSTLAAGCVLLAIEDS